MRKKRTSVINQKTIPDMTETAAILVLEQNIDPALITGTGVNGRITKKDVVSYIEAQAKNRAAITEEE